MNVQRVAQRQVILPVGQGEAVTGDLAAPPGAAGIVVFAHGSGSSRLSSRNRGVAATLQHAGFATLLFDLLSPSEEERDAVTAELRFDIPFLAERLRDVMRWVRAEPTLAGFPLGLFGASTGAAAALVAAADDRPPGAQTEALRQGRSDEVGAIVSRGGRPDLARDALERVSAPTLLIVGGLDHPVIDMNRSAFDRLAATDKELVIVPAASHLFEEPGKLDEVARLASSWFERWLGRSA